MSLRGDDRAVTVQIGAVLLFATLIVAMSMYQAVVVPDQNARAEYEHGQRVQADMVDLRNAVLRTAATGASQPTSVAVGMRYPERLVFVNPPPASGTLRTGPERTLVVSNASALDPDARDYWNGDARTFSTRDLVYEPQYRGYDDAPATVYGQTVLYNRFEGADVTLSGQSVIDGRRITLVTLAGARTATGTTTLSVDPRPLSPSTATVQTLTVGNGSGPVTLTIPTRLPAAAWDDLLADQAYVDAVAQNGTGAVDVALDPGVAYELRMARIGVGPDVSPAEPHYVTKVRDGGDDLVVEVRDRYGNPVSGVRVNATVETGNGTVEPASGANGTTDGSGRAWFRYEAAPDDERVVVNASFDGGDAPRERTKFAFSVGDAGGDGSGGGGSDEPVREQFDIADNSNSNHAKYGANWAVADPDGDLTTVTVELLNASSGDVVDSTTYGADGSWTDRRSGTTFLQKRHGAGGQYVIRLTAHDAADNEVSWERNDVADGSDPS